MKRGQVAQVIAFESDRSSSESKLSDSVGAMDEAAGKSAVESEEEVATTGNHSSNTSSAVSDTEANSPRLASVVEQAIADLVCQQG
jgi:hypothetical protein